MRRDSNTAHASQALELLLSLLLGSLANGCLSGALSEGNAAQPHLDTKVFPVSCDDGRRYAARTMKVRSYRITGVDRSASQTTVSGRNETDKASGSITVTCQAEGVTVATDGPTQWVKDGLRFGFYQLVETGDRIWPPPTAPVVAMNIYQGVEAKIEFPSELEPLGIVGVRVKILNAGDRTIRIDPKRLLATTASGSPVRPISGAEAQQKLGGTDPEIGKKLLNAAKLKKGESVVGFVFFPAATYESASIALIDDKTGEADDYDVHLTGIS
jgi:hypothetical protein